MVNNGSIQGSIEEVAFIIYFNKNKPKYSDYLINFSFEASELWLVRVTTKQFSDLSNRLVYTRSDAYLIHTVDENIITFLQNNEYFIDEDILNNNNFEYIKVPYSGISIKITNSKYQILKLTPNSFASLFGSYELGAGASLFSQSKDELYKNAELLKGWSTNEDKMKEYFHDIFVYDRNLLVDQKLCETIKHYSINKIHEIINNSVSLQKKIFNGYNLYQEPYTAWYFSQNNNLIELKYIPFSITTGSGRSRGNYSLVLKPIR